MQHRSKKTLNEQKAAEGAKAKAAKAKAAQNISHPKKTSFLCLPFLNYGSCSFTVPFLT